MLIKELEKLYLKIMYSRHSHVLPVGLPMEADTIKIANIVIYSLELAIPLWGIII